MLQLSRTTIIILAVAAIGVIILLFVLFKGKRKIDLRQAEIVLMDSLIAAEKSKQVLYERLIEEKDRTNEVLQSRDSVLNAHYNETEKLYKSINDKLRQIPGRINRIATNNDSLRLLLAEY